MAADHPQLLPLPFMCTNNCLVTQTLTRESAAQILWNLPFTPILPFPPSYPRPGLAQGVWSRSVITVKV